MYEYVLDIVCVVGNSLIIHIICLELRLWLHVAYNSLVNKTISMRLPQKNNFNNNNNDNNIYYNALTIWTYCCLQRYHFIPTY